MSRCIQKQELLCRFIIKATVILFLGLNFFHHASSQEKNFGEDWSKFKHLQKVTSPEKHRRQRQTSAATSAFNLSSLYFSEALNLGRNINNFGYRCPKECQCLLGNLKVQCSFRHLIKVPLNLPDNVQSLNLAHNDLFKLTPNVFGRLALTELFLEKNSLVSLERTFTNLPKLGILRLSWNKVVSIRKLTLRDLTDLEKLYLDNNRIIFLHPEAFRGLVKLNLLDLSNNRLIRLHQDTFVTTRFGDYFRFSHVQILDLSNNQFTILSPNLITSFGHLKEIYLHGNKWECSCMTSWFLQWVKKVVSFRCKQINLQKADSLQCPVCFSPERLKNQQIIGISRNNVTCNQPRIVGQETITITESFPEDPSSIKHKNDEYLFQYTNKPRPHFSIQFFGVNQSIATLHCNSTREPQTNVVYQDSFYKGTMLMNMDCFVEFPTDQEKIKLIFQPFLRTQLILKTPYLTETNQLKNETVTYMVKNGQHNSTSTEPILLAKLTSNFPCFKTAEATLSLIESHFHPVERLISVDYRTTTEHRSHKKSQRRGFPWTLAGEPSSEKTSSKVVIEGKFAIIRCKAMGYPKPILSWILPSGKLLNPMKQMGRFRVNRGGRLLIFAVSRSDEGVYRCMSRSKQKLSQQVKAAAAIGSLRLHVLTSLLPLFPPLVRHVNVQEGKAWNHSCVTEATPQSEIAWTTPDEKVLRQRKISQDSPVLTSSGTISISNISKFHEGFYRCIAVNAVGASEITIYVKVLLKSKKVMVSHSQVLNMSFGQKKLTTPKSQNNPSQIDGTEQYDSKTQIATSDATAMPKSIFTSKNLITSASSHNTRQLRPTVTTKITSNERVTRQNVNTSFISFGNLKATLTDKPGNVSPANVMLTTIADDIVKVDLRTTVTLSKSESTISEKNTAYHLSTALIPLQKTNSSFINHTQPEDVDRRPSLNASSYRYPDSSNEQLGSIKESNSAARMVNNGIKNYVDHIVHSSIDDLNLTTVSYNFIKGKNNNLQESFIYSRKSINSSRSVQDLFRVEYGDAVTIRCRISNAPPLQWKFYFRTKSSKSYLHSRIIENLEEIKYLSFLNPITVLISRATSRHNGTFQCRNSAGEMYRAYLIVTASPPLVTQPIFSQITVEYGKSLTIPCTANGNPAPNVMWLWKEPRQSRAVSKRFINDTELNGTLVYTQPDNTLHIENITPSFEIEYKCIAQNLAGEANHSVSVLVISQAPKIEKINPEKIVKEREKFQMDCKVHAKPQARPKWILPDGSVVVQGSSNNLNENILSNGSLLVSSAKKQHQGEFTCIAANPLGQAKIKVKVHVLLSQENNPRREIVLSTIKTTTTTTTIITTTEKEKASTTATTNRYTSDVTTQKDMVYTRQYKLKEYVRQGESAFLQCRSSFSRHRSFDEQRNRWFTNRVNARWRTPSGGHAAFPYPVPSWRHRVFVNGTLRIADVRKADSGIYNCEVKDYLGRKFRTKASLVVFSQSPSIHQSLHEVIYISRGRAVWAPCSASGYPKPFITWTTPRGRTFSPGAYGAGFRVFSNGKLMLYSATNENVGVYTCSASNSAGSMTRLVVFKLRTIAPKILGVSSTMQHVRVGESTKLSCPAVGEPDPHVYWNMPGGKTIEKNQGGFVNGYKRSKTSMLSSGTLVIQRATLGDGGLYHCTATNYRGSDRKTVNLKVYY